MIQMEEINNLTAQLNEKVNEVNELADRATKALEDIDRFIDDNGLMEWAGRAYARFNDFDRRYAEAHDLPIITILGLPGIIKNRLDADKNPSLEEETQLIESLQNLTPDMTRAPTEILLDQGQTLSLELSDVQQILKKIVRKSYAKHGPTIRPEFSILLCGEHLGKAYQRVKASDLVQTKRIHEEVNNVISDALVNDAYQIILYHRTIETVVWTNADEGIATAYTLAVL